MCNQYTIKSLLKSKFYLISGLQFRKQKKYVAKKIFGGGSNLGGPLPHIFWSHVARFQNKHPEVALY
jgi:hypothetical protein